jgi:hypothetical protein
LYIYERQLIMALKKCRYYIETHSQPLTRLILRREGAVVNRKECGIRGAVHTTAFKGAGIRVGGQVTRSRDPQMFVQRCAHRAKTNLESFL